MNVLSFEPREVTLEHGATVKFWRLFVDGKRLTDRAAPFSASDDRITLQQCHLCGLCGERDVAARRANQTVLWYVCCDEEVPCVLDRDQALAFDQVRYEETVGGNSGELAEITSEELVDLLRRLKLPDWHDGLYTIPDVPDDLSGKLALHLLQDVVNGNVGEIRVVQAPGDAGRLQIGLDVEGVPECILQFGKEGTDIAIRLEEHPRFPVWITSPTITESFRAYLESSGLLPRESVASEMRKRLGKDT